MLCVRECLLTIALFQSLIVFVAASGYEFKGNGQYDEQTALQLAYLNTAGYCGDNVSSWQCGPACEHVPNFTDVRVIDSPGDTWDAFSFLGKMGSQCFVVFRGTTDWSGAFQDLKSVELVDLPGCAIGNVSCKVGKGWWENYNLLAPQIISNLSAMGCDRAPFKDRGLAVTGHSLGGAVAAVAMFDLNRIGYQVSTKYTFGQPLTGDATFATVFNDRFPNMFRVTHAMDPVPHVPLPSMGFAYVGVEVFYKGYVSQGYKVCFGVGPMDSCSGQFGQSIEALGRMVYDCERNVEDCAHLRYMADLMSIPLDSTHCANKVNMSRKASGDGDKGQVLIV